MACYSKTHFQDGIIVVCVRCYLLFSSRHDLTGSLSNCHSMPKARPAWR